MDRGALRAASVGDVDPLAGLIDRRFLGRSAGHGTFIAGLCHQVVPAAELVVHRIANTEGFVDELGLADRLDRIGDDDEPAPDVILLCFGGYSVKLGSFNTSGNGDQWTSPQVLLAALRALLERCPHTVIVASAGNNESTDPCFPAALSGWKEFADRVVSVAALDSSGYRWTLSNYGDWVSASTLGVRLRSIYVPGREHPDNDPDGTPERFRSPAYASWTGTSFAAPLVAARIVELQERLAASYGRPVGAVEAWSVLRASSRPHRQFGGGVHVVVDGVPHD